MDKVTSKGGGANQLAKYLEELSDKIKIASDNNKIVIGVFDNDAKGYQEFNGLKSNFELINGIVKKDKTKNVYAILLPIPNGEEYKPYHQDKQVFKFFAIEHYFAEELLRKEKMITETSITGVFEVTGDKNAFSTDILKNIDCSDFKNFISLLHEIDNITKREESYIDC